VRDVRDKVASELLLPSRSLDFFFEPLRRRAHRFGDFADRPDRRNGDFDVQVSGGDSFRAPL
jgi:hypothetical protein